MTPLASHHEAEARATLGMSSIVLGTIGFLLFFLPILGVPLGAFGLLVGIAGAFKAGFDGRSQLRKPLVGIVVSSTAVSIGLAIAFAPLGYEPHQAAPRLWQTPADRPSIPPPARPGSVSTQLDSGRR